MTKKSVLFRKDEECEMLEVYIDGKLYYSGNYWDFDFASGDVRDLLDKLGIENSEETYSYEDEEDE